MAEWGGRGADGREAGPMPVSAARAERRYLHTQAAWLRLSLGQAWAACGAAHGRFCAAAVRPPPPGTRRAACRWLSWLQARDLAGSSDIEVLKWANADATRLHVVQPVVEFTAARRPQLAALLANE